MPEKYRKRYEAKYGDPVELLKKQQMKDKIKIDDKAREFYAAFEYDLNGVQRHLDEDLQKQYIINASVLNMMIHDLNDKVALTKALNNSRRDLWDIIDGSCAQLRETYAHTLPNNKARLRDKMREYRRPLTYNGETYPHNYRCLISGKIGNVNTLKITAEVGELLIALKCSRKPVYTDSQLFERFNAIELPKHNARVSDKKALWKPLKSEKSMREWLNQPENQQKWYGMARGSLADRQKFSIGVPLEGIGKRDVRWEGDGTKLNLYYKGKDGMKTTCTVYEVMDAYSEALLGYWIADREDYLQQYHAFRMAVQQTRRNPYEIVTDNQGGAKTKKMKDFMSAISHVARTTLANNPQSKTIESAFGRYQRFVMRQKWYFTGQNITSRKEESKPNLEFINANEDNLPTLEEVKSAYIELREMWNGQRAMETTGEILKHHKSGIPRMEMYLQSENELAPETTEREMAESFWLWTDRQSEYKRDGISITVDKVEYTYEVFKQDEVDARDTTWISKNMYHKFWVKYDPYDMSQVKLYWEDKAGGIRFERLASPPVKIHKAIQEQEAGERAKINEILSINRQMQIERYLDAQEIMWKHGTAPEQHRLRSPKLPGFNNEQMAEVNLMLERRTRKYRSTSIAQENKDISMMTYEEAQEYDEQEARKTLPLKRMAGKL
jgi:hypothetical protein